MTTQDELEELAVTLCDKLMKAVNTSTPKVYTRNNPKSPISQAILGLDLIKEKRRLRRLYSNTQDPNIKSTINRLQKEIRTKIIQESTISWEKFCNSISLESDPKQSWHKITNFLKPKGPRSYPTLKLRNKTAKTNPERAQLFSESVERNFGIESYLFCKSQFDCINKFVEAHLYHFIPLGSLSDIRLALRLPKYVSALLLHEALGLQYVRERLIRVGQNHLARMHAKSTQQGPT